MRAGRRARDAGCGRRPRWPRDDTGIPGAVASRWKQTELLSAASFVDVRELDVTADFIRTARLWFEYGAQFEPQLREAVGNEQYDQQQSDRSTILKAIEERLLSRALFLGRKAERQAPDWRKSGRGLVRGATRRRPRRSPGRLGIGPWTAAS
jgi:hypothetical protein